MAAGDARGASDVGGGYLERVRAVRRAQCFKERYSNLVSRHLSCWLTAALSPTRATPNQVTAAMLPVGLLGGVLLSLGSGLGFVAGGLCFVLLNVLDASDGELARFTGRTSAAGDYLDRVLHYVTNTCAFLGLGIGLAAALGARWPLLVAVALDLAYTFDEVSRDLLARAGEGRKGEKAATRLGGGGRGRRALLELTATNIAFFHLVPLLALGDLGARWLIDGWPRWLLVGAYLVGFTAATVVKAGLRFARHTWPRASAGHGSS